MAKTLKRKNSDELKEILINRIENKLTNKKEIETIFDELILLDKKDFESMMKYVFNKKYQSLYINTDKADNKMYHKNFNELMFREKIKMWIYIFKDLLIYIQYLRVEIS